MATLKTILTDHAPIPAGHYSQAIKHNNLLYLAGQLPIQPGSAEKKVGSIAEQTRQVLANIDAVLEAGGSRKDKVLKVTVFVSDISLWSEVNAEYAAYFGNHKPARSIVPVNTLHYGYQIEMDIIAACD